MPLLRIENLRANIWASLTFEERLGALQELENGLAEQEGREPCSIAPIPEDERIVEDEETLLRGRYIPSSDGPGAVQIDPNLISDDEPYQAVETFFHEDRHAYQAYAAQHPEIHDNPEEVEDWQKTNDGGYINSDLNFDYYRWQPVEADANNIARERTDELYSGTFQDGEKYPAYKSEKEQELSDDIERAQMNLGENYQEEARQAMIAKYQSTLEQQENPSEAHAESVGEASLEDEGIAPSGSPPSASESESEDYSYGYGY